MQVLDKGFVLLQGCMGNDLSIVNAARTSFLGESKGEDADTRLLEYLIKNRHDSPLEMVELKFLIKAPLMVFNQWVRHRAGHFNAQSYRYTEAEAEEFYIPEEWRTQSSTNKQASDGVLEDDGHADLTELYDLVIGRCYDAYQHALSLGVAREQARIFLPAFGLYTTFVWKVDARNLLAFLDLRTKSNAQYEMRQYAFAVKKLAEPIIPKTFEYWEKYRGY